MMKNEGTSSRGLTLVELLAVVVIISLLAILLVPLLRHTGVALRLKCQSNLRELGQMLVQYSHQHGRELPDFSYSRWCGSIGAVEGGVYSWTVLPGGQMAWFIDEREGKIFLCPAQPASMLNTQGVRSSYAGLAIHSSRSLPDLKDSSRRVLLFEFEHDPAQVLQSIGTSKPYLYAYDSFEPSSGPLWVARNHGEGGFILFADLHSDLVEGPEREIGKWEEAYRAGEFLLEGP